MAEMALSSFQFFFFTSIFEPPPIDTSRRRTLYTMSESHICEPGRCGPEGVSAYGRFDCIKQVIFFLFLSLGQRATNQMPSLPEL